jgi:hypothetical protein
MTDQPIDYVALAQSHKTIEQQALDVLKEIALVLGKIEWNTRDGSAPMPKVSAPVQQTQYQQKKR